MIFINYNLQMYSIKLKYINGNKLIFMLFYLYIIEGPLVNNKDLYDLYLANPITIDEYKILRKPIPLYHETMYSIYSLRLQILGYIPLHENIWTEEMIKLRLIPNDWPVKFSNERLKSTIVFLLEIEKMEKFNYRIAL
ncbi:uncharacterized protein LOC126549116 isoform X1 [Aphis gossypii]|uniref:uncharacterized protein LOC126549116 isoform X1 n=1 Tax=Aphis gossypii TaxID=80765 RepID=UPI002158DE39|nr:uncharacterized protein LOC126549116 isoform X1 [Aphis gossypii]